MTGRTIISTVLILIVIFTALESARRIHNQNLDITLFYASAAKSPDDQPHEARVLSAQDLLRRPLATNLTTVPKIFHQSWSTSTLPIKFEKWSRSCREAHPDWEWVLWTDQDNLDLVRLYAPWFLPTYEALGDHIPVYRADVVRNLYMHIFGGVYADLDMECLRSSDTLFEAYRQPGRQAFLGRMGSDDSSSASLPNAWFASTPGHPFWVLPLEYVESKIHEDLTAEGLSGPGALYKVVEEYRDTYAGDEMNRHYAQSGWRNLFQQPDPIMSDKDDQTVTILPQWEIYPYSWLPIASPYSHFCWTRAELFDERMCKLLLGTEEQGSHAITYWSHTWGDDGGGHDTKGWKSISEQES